MSEKPRFDQATYESSKQYLKAALEHMIEAGRSVRDLSEFALEKFGDDFLPYLRQFLHDVAHGGIDIKGLTQSAKTALLGHHVSPAAREAMIREAAYLRAEQRGFSGDMAADDWIAAEREVDARLASEAGLVVKGSKVLASATAIVEKELATSRQVVTHWLEKRFPAQGKAPKKKSAAGAKADKAVKKKAAKPKAEKEAPKKKAKAAVKKTVKKAAKKSAAKKEKGTAD
jgi:hypothetical protein